MEVLLLAERLGLRIEEVPVEWRHVEESRVRPMRDGLVMMRDALRIRFALSARGRPPVGTAVGDETRGAPASPEGDRGRRRAER